MSFEAFHAALGSMFIVSNSAILFATHNVLASVFFLFRLDLLFLSFVKLLIEFSLKYALSASFRCLIASNIVFLDNSNHGFLRLMLSSPLNKPSAVILMHCDNQSYGSSILLLLLLLLILSFV